MDCERTNLILGILADDLDDAGERAEAERHLEDCSVCQEALADYRGLAAALRELPPEQPTESARARAYAAVLEAMEQAAADAPPAAGDEEQAPVEKAGQLLRLPSPEAPQGSAVGRRDAGATGLGGGGGVLLKFFQGVAAAACLLLAANLFFWGPTAPIPDNTARGPAAQPPQLGRKTAADRPAPRTGVDDETHRGPDDTGQTSPEDGLPPAEEAMAGPSPDGGGQPPAPQDDPAPQPERAESLDQAVANLDGDVDELARRVLRGNGEGLDDEAQGAEAESFGDLADAGSVAEDSSAGEDWGGFDGAPAEAPAPEPEPEYEADDEDGARLELALGMDGAESGGAAPGADGAAAGDAGAPGATSPSMGSAETERRQNGARNELQEEGDGQGGGGPQRTGRGHLSRDESPESGSLPEPRPVTPRESPPSDPRPTATEPAREPEPQPDLAPGRPPADAPQLAGSLPDSPGDATSEGEAPLAAAWIVEGENGARRLYGLRGDELVLADLEDDSAGLLRRDNFDDRAGPHRGRAAAVSTVAPVHTDALDSIAVTGRRASPAEDSRAEAELVLILHDELRRAESGDRDVEWRQRVEPLVEALTKLESDAAGVTSGAGRERAAGDPSQPPAPGPAGGQASSLESLLERLRGLTMAWSRRSRLRSERTDAARDAQADPSAR
jgi:hypothetical protein